MRRLPFYARAGAALAVRGEQIFQDGQALVGQFLGQDQRRAEADGAGAGAQQQQAALEGFVHDLVAQVVAPGRGWRGLPPDRCRA